MGFGLVAAIVGVLATAASAYVTYQGQQYSKAVAKQTGEHNAKVEENAAIQADMEARENIARERSRNRRFQSSQRAALAKSGITEAGSPLEVLGETAGQIELSALDAMHASQARTNLGFAQAQNTRAETAAAAKGYDLAMTGTLLTGAANVSSQVGAYKYSGALKKG